ncbi:hypothetical protein OSB04_un000672 [Centaurea solstitialis]|uniref:Uncharacterized protein n=1 Tax=Centaurea solstitialis TaxID=347529 RepID=A0AA38SC46_9ASTR|nr:hypothetical protein OSB04_un000672 [Centaurea solstitialis]
MEGSSSTSHFRSISLPSRLTNPSCTKIETKINELKALGSLVVSSESIQSGLVGLAELYVCVEELVRSPKTQPALSRHQNGNLVEDALDRSIGLLDLCSTLKDLLMLMRENVQILQSSLRRKGDVDHHVSLMVNKVLGEVYALTISQFKSVLVFVSTKTKSTSGVQLISKLVSKSTSTQAKSITSISEMETIDLVITSLQKSLCNGDTNNPDIQMTLKKLHILDASLEGFEAGLDCIFRRLIQSRASVLNINSSLKIVLEIPAIEKICTSCQVVSELELNSENYLTMDTQETVLVSKVPMLKPNEFDMWKIRIRQYMLLTDYGMWEVVGNGPGIDEGAAE